MGLFKKMMLKLGITKRKVKILVCGLDNAGKSTIINWMKPKHKTDVAPTVAFKKEDFTRGNVHFTAVDMSGASRYRDLWQQFYGDVDGLVFVIDASDEIRFCVARDELMQMLGDEKLTASIPLLILANKMDLPGAKTKQEVMGALDIKAVIDRPMTMEASNALTGQGLVEAFAWLGEQIRTDED